MRIVVLVEGYNALGGIAEIVDSLAAEFLRFGHQVAVLSTRDRRAAGNRQERTPRDGVGCTFVKIRNRKPLSLRHLEMLWRVPFEARWGALARLISAWAPEVVNSQLCTWDRYPTVTAICRAAGVPLVQSFHVSDTRGEGSTGRRGLAALARAQGFIAGSAATREFFAGLLPAAREARVIIGGVDAGAIGAATPWRRARPYILCACRLLLRHKAIDVLIRAFGSIQADFPDIDLLIAGGGEDRARIEQLIGEAELNGRIEMLGVKSREQMAALHKGALMFAMPSRPGECLPVVYLEALAAGTPVVATDTGGVRELIRSGVNGLLVAEEDAEGLAEAMRRLLGDAEARRAMGERGRHEVLARYTWSKCAAGYLEAFRSCLPPGRPSPPGG